MTNKELMIGLVKTSGVDAKDVGAILMGPSAYVGKLEREKGNSAAETAALGSALGLSAAGGGLMFKKTLPQLRKLLANSGGLKRPIPGNKALAALLLAGGAVSGATTGLIGRLFGESPEKYASRIKEAGAISSTLGYGIPTLIGGAIGKKMTKGLTFEDRVRVQMEAHGMNKREAIKAVYERDEDHATPDGKKRQLKSLIGPGIGAGLGLLAALGAKGKIKGVFNT